MGTYRRVVEYVQEIPGPVPSFDDVREALGQIGASTGAAEWHGLVCGQICAIGGVDEESCLREVLGEHQVDEGMLDESCVVLRALARDTVRQFSPTDWGFYPLLPDDEEPMPVRSAAVGEWCRGFLYGIRQGGVGEDAWLSDDCR